MKTFAIVSYIIGCILFVVACFTQTVSTVWWLGAFSIVFLILGCIFQYKAKREQQQK
ncbi:MAG: hypothetical protein UHP27_04420 [Muribaculaceae bacterium]|nr:hypothetical protein [Muribaculaceae bacterium]